MARGKSQFRVRDRQRIRRVLAGMPEATHKEVLAAYQRHAPAILAVSRAEAPSRRGKLRAALAFRIYPKALRLRIGLLTKRVQRSVWYARILEYGRKARAVRVERRRPVSGGMAVYIMRVKAIPAGRYDFVRGRTQEFMERTLGRDVRNVLGRALRKLSAGA